MIFSRFIPLFCLLAWAGCSVGPKYQAPKIVSAPSYGETNILVNTNIPVTNWWHTFHDKELDRLISQALRTNLDLQAALSRVRQSRFQRNLAAADLYPTVDANGSYVHSRGSKNVQFDLGNDSSSSGGNSTQSTARRRTQNGSSVNNNNDVSPNPFSTQPNPFGQGGFPGKTTDLYQVGFDASWEIDVFGGKRRAVEAAAAEVESETQSYYNSQLSLAAETARDYLELRGDQERLRIALANYSTQSNILFLTRSQTEVGLSSQLNVNQAAAQADQTAASVPSLEASCRVMMHALAVLVDQPPTALIAELSQPAPVPPAPPQVPVGLPSQLLKRRPDIQMAEREIKAQNARVGMAVADWFPKFALTGMAGLDSSSPGTLFNWGSRYFLISPSVTWRIFDAGRISANVKLQKAMREENELDYRSTILKALQDVEDALVNYATEIARRNQLQDQVRQNQDALDLSLKQYQQGLTDFINVLDSERTLLSAQDQLAQSAVMTTTDVVALYKALGGGWEAK